MALTRPTIQNINTNLTAFTDSLTVTNFGNVANRDIGEVFDRSRGSVSNVASFWQESTNSFAYAYTSSTGLDGGNLTVTSYANLITGNITTDKVTTGNLTVTGTPSFSSGISVDQLLSSNSSAQLYSNTQSSITIGGASTTVNIASSNRSTSTSTGALVISGGLGVAGNAFVGGNLIVVGNLLVSNVIYETSEYVSSTEVVAGNSTVNGLTVNTSATVGTTFRAAGGIQNTVIGNSTAAAGTFTTVTATSTVNGPLNGTLGAAGGNTAIVSTLTATSNATVNGLTVNASATIGTSLSVAGNVITGTGNGGTITGANVISANYFIGNGAGITYVNAANVSGTIPNASFSTTAGTVTTAAQPNITSVGTLTGLTLSGSLSGTAIYASTFGNNGANFTGNVFSAATTSTANLLVTTGSNLGNVTTINISGGSPGYVIKTDGFGNLSWGPDLSGGITYTAGTAPPTSGNLVGDQWFSTVNDVLYEYSYDGVSYYWVDISSTVLSANLTPQDILNPFLLMGA